MINYLKTMNWGRFLAMCIGNVFVAMGVSIFKLSALGNDPYNGMAMALSDVTGIGYGAFYALVSGILFLFQILTGRKYIGPGTFFNALLNGYITAFFYGICLQLFGAQSNLPLRIIIVCIGVIIVSFGLSLYQTSDMGISPYDYLSVGASTRFPKISYFWHRILDDAICTLIIISTGGLIGIGTLVAAFGMGPFIQFFDHHFSRAVISQADMIHESRKL